MDGRSGDIVYCFAKDFNTIVAEIHLYTHVSSIMHNLNKSFPLSESERITMILHTLTESKLFDIRATHFPNQKQMTTTLSSVIDTFATALIPIITSK